MVLAFPLVLISALLSLSLIVLASTAQQSLVGYPTQMTLDATSYEVAPSGLTLEQVHVYIRHGERTPVGVRMVDPPASIPEFWDLCRAARRFKAAVLGSKHDEVEPTLELRRVVERRDGTSNDNECMLGELTDLGRQSTYNFGTTLRSLYIDQLKFLPDAISQQDEVYYRSTNMPRTIESLQQVVHGLYPNSKCKNEIIPRIRVRHARDENLVGNTFGCRRLQELLYRFEQEASREWNTSLEPLDHKLSKYIGGNPIRINGKPRASGILDTVRAAQAHGIKVPKEFYDNETMATIEHAVVAEWFTGYYDEEVRRLAMGRLLEDLDTHFQSKVNKGKEEPLKISVNACHDTSIAGLCATLDVFDGQWPDFTASITFELFRRKNQSVLSTYLPYFFQSSLPPEYFVRMRYQNRSLPLPTCSAPGNHLEGHKEFCTLSAFQKRVKELVPKNWDAECDM